MSYVYIGMVHHDHEGVWPEEHEPYPCWGTAEKAEEAADRLCKDATKESGRAVRIQLP